jgi:hypothetical protein
MSVVPNDIITKFDAFPVASSGSIPSINSIPGDIRPAGRIHEGIDISDKIGTRIVSVLPGTVYSVTTNKNSDGGLQVVVKHIKKRSGTVGGFEFDVAARDDIYWAMYSHLDSISVTAGQVLTATQEIGRMGNTGISSTGVHLHFELWWGGRIGNTYSFEERRSKNTLITNLYQIVVNTAQDLEIRYNDRIGSRDTIPVDTPIEQFRPNEAYITPYITTTDSFHPKIQYELTRRREAAETANVYMPFIKLTALTHVKDVNLSDTSNDLKIETNKFNAWCPTLGVHGEPTVDFDDIYSTRSNRSAIGYATALNNQGNPVRTKVYVEQSNIDTDPKDIPMPGIVSVTTDKSTAGPMGVRGGLFRANIKINAYSVGQLNALLRYFLRPATRVVLEFGRISTSKFEPNLDTFNWTRPLNKQNGNEENGILDDIGNIAQLKANQRTFIDKYVYGNYGNYDILIGYVVNFKTKYTKDNVYEIDLTVHSVQQFEVPTKISGTQPVCSGTSIPAECKVLDVVDYFDPTSIFKVNNFLRLLINTAGQSSSPWHKHVIPLRGQGADSPRAGTPAPGFLLSWTFFINKVLNDEVDGLLSIFQLNRGTDGNSLDIMRKSIPGPIVSANDPRYRSLVGSNAINSNEVGWNKYLRSTNPGVMVIYNSSANTIANQSSSFARAAQLGFISTRNEIKLRDRTGEEITITGDAAAQDLRDKSATYTFLSDAIIAATTLGSTEATSGVPKVGEFIELNGETESGVSSLTTGVWLNSNAIISAFTSTDTITAALVKLLTDMNAATEGYWNLQLLSDEINNSGLHIIDMGVSKGNRQKPRPRVDTSVKGSLDDRETELREFETNNYLYLFNRKLQRGTTTDMGSELLDITLDIGLPQVVAVQAIAGVGGVAARATLQAIDSTELNTISLFKLYPSCSNAGTCGDPSDEEGTYALPAELSYSEINNLALKFINETPVGTSLSELTNRQKIAIRQLVERRPISTNSGGPSAAVVAGNLRSVAETLVLQRIKEIQTEFEQTNSSLLAYSERFNSTFGSALLFCEYDKTTMVKHIDDNRLSGKVHAFNSSNLTKTTVDMTLPGIAGIQLFQAFAVDRVPNILDKGYYVVTRVAHEFTLDRGWLTKLQGRFRYNPDETQPTVSSGVVTTGTQARQEANPSERPVHPSGHPAHPSERPVHPWAGPDHFHSIPGIKGTIIDPNVVAPWRRR